MKSLVRWGATLSLIGGTVLTTVIGGVFPALAISEQEITQKLNEVPVFLVTNKEGVPLSRPLEKPKDGQKAPGGAVTGVYMSQQEAQAFVQELRQSKPKDPKKAQMFNSLQVTPVPLGLIYKQLQDTKDKPNRLLFAFKPVEREVQGAMKLLRDSGQQVKEIRSVPIFLVRFAQDKGYVSIKPKAGNEEFVPAFLSKKDAEGLLQQVKPKYPKANIHVVDVDNVIKTLQEKDDKWLERVVFWPSPEARQFIQKLPQNKTPSPSAAPAKQAPANQAPAKKK